VSWNGVLDRTALRGRKVDEERRHRIAIERREGTDGEELRPVLAGQEAESVDERGPVTDQPGLIPSEHAHLDDRVGRRHEPLRQRQLLAPDASTRLGIDGVALVNRVA
jgi:hypothetical protein